MGTRYKPDPVLLTLSLIFRHEKVRTWAITQLEHVWGPLALTSDLFPFTETQYYTARMGSDLQVQLLAFKELIDPANLADIKLQTNEIEHLCCEQFSLPEDRPVNLDPGYLTLGKFILASTKDGLQRIYLHSGIYAEITLHFKDRRWQAFPWTYPNYRREDYGDFLLQCRQFIRTATS